MNDPHVEPIPANEWAAASRLLAMVEPRRSPQEWLAWLKHQGRDANAETVGIRLEGQWVAVSQSRPASMGFVGQWLPVLHVATLGIHPGYVRATMVRPLLAAAKQRSEQFGAVLLRCEESLWGRLGTFGFVPQAPVQLLTCPPDHFAFTPKPLPARPGLPADLEQVAALYAERSTQVTGLDPRPPAVWQEFAPMLAPDGPYRMIVCESEGRIAGYAIYLPDPGMAQSANVTVLDWVDRSVEATRSLATYFYQMQHFVGPVRVPLWPDRPLSLVVHDAFEASVLLQRGPSLHVVNPAPLLAAHLPDSPFPITIREGSDTRTFRCTSGHAMPTDEPGDVTLDRRTLAQVAGGALSVAEAYSLGAVNGSPHACHALVEAWRSLPFFRSLLPES